MIIQQRMELDEYDELTRARLKQKLADGPPKEMMVEATLSNDNIVICALCENWILMNDSTWRSKAAWRECQDASVCSERRRKQARDRSLNRRAKAKLASLHSVQRR
jgi:hypothetical protein